MKEEEILKWLDTRIKFALKVKDTYDSTYRSSGIIRAYREIKKQIRTSHNDIELGWGDKSFLVDLLNMSKKYIGYDSGNTFLDGYWYAIKTFKEYIR